MSKTLFPFPSALAALEAAGVSIVESPNAEESLRKLRQTYEPFLQGLSDRLLLTVPPLLNEGGVPDNWERSAWMKPAPGVGALAVEAPNEWHFG